MIDYAALACNRFGLGAMQGEIERVSRDPKNWLRQQLNSSVANSFPDSDLGSSNEIINTFTQINKERRALKKAGQDIKQITQTRRKFMRSTFTDETNARLKFGAETANPFHERLTRFWSNHFSVAAKNGQLRLIVGAYEREAIRPNVMGNFADLAESAIFHPAMLIYLDNQQSIGPNSRVGLKRSKGLNENLAREVMELHTLTPDSGYTQDDVTEFARALTGWTVFRNPKLPRRAGRSFFGKNRHEPGVRYVMGNAYDETGARQAKDILLDFCANPHTAKNVAYSLAKHFLADGPPANLVDKLKDSFLSTGGDLIAIYTTLIDAEEMWEREAKKVKTPMELITSTARLMGLETAITKRPNAVFRSFAQRPFTAPTPEGWSDDASDWLGADALTKRIEWANRIGKKNPNLDAVALMQDGLGNSLSQDSLEAIQRAESTSDALALSLLTPEFQRR